MDGMSAAASNRQRTAALFRAAHDSSATWPREFTPSLSEPSTEEAIRIFRRELEARLPPDLAPHMATTSPSFLFSVAMVQAVVQRGNRKLRRITVPMSNVSHSTSPTYPPVSGPIFSQRPRRDPAAWLTPDDRPIFFHSEAVGHISRYCPRCRPSRPRHSFPPAPAPTFTVSPTERPLGRTFVPRPPLLNFSLSVPFPPHFHFATSSVLFLSVSRSPHTL